MSRLQFLNLCYNLLMSFFEKFKKLIDGQPHLCVHVWKSENSDYCDQLDGCKKCYLCFNNRLSQDCMYAYDSRWNKDCTDVSFCNKCELCYESLDCEKCYDCRFCQDCEGCDGCEFSYDLKSCKNCFGCVGLRHKKFWIFNEEAGEEGYFERVEKLKKGEGKGVASDTDGCEVIEKKFNELKLKHPHISLYSLNSENSFGNYIVNSKNSYYVFKVHNLEDCFYMYDCQEDKDCVDCCAFNKSELCYECMENSMLYNCNFMYWCATCVDCEYMMYSFDCKDCFGCFGLRHKRYCILNEQCASASEYSEKLAQIKKSMSEDGVVGWEGV